MRKHALINAKSVLRGLLLFCIIILTKAQRNPLKDQGIRSEIIERTLSTNATLTNTSLLLKDNRLSKDDTAHPTTPRSVPLPRFLHSLPTEHTTSHLRTSQRNIADRRHVLDTKSFPSSPSTSCDGKVLTIDIQTDYFYSETSWFVTDSDGNEIMAHDDYSTHNEAISKSRCVGISPGCFKLTVIDEYGDGINTLDAIKAYIDDIEIYTSGKTLGFYHHTVDIGLGCLSGSHTFENHEDVISEKDTSRELQDNGLCEDSPEGWYDSYGSMYDCDWYATGSRCASFGNGFMNFGKVANEACCVCGGGVQIGTYPSSVPAPSNFPSAKYPSIAPFSGHFPSNIPSSIPSGVDTYPSSVPVLMYGQYLVMDNNTNWCADGYESVTLSECEGYADNTPDLLYGTLVNNNYYPKGCFILYGGPYVYFNSHPTGSVNSIASPICKLNSAPFPAHLPSHLPSSYPGNAPTYFPTPPSIIEPSTATPASSCGDLIPIRVELYTDSYPSDTSWTIRNVVTDEIVLEGGGYTDRDTLFTEIIEVCSNDCFQFIIYDSYGDGFLYAGYYKVFYNEELLKEGDSFSYQQSSDPMGGECPSNKPSLSLKPSASPSSLPSKWPSKLPSEQPSSPASSCGDFILIEIRVELYTDYYPSETSWTIRNVVTDEIVLEGAGYTDRYTLFTEIINVCSNDCFQFTIYDSYGDGLGYDGYYKVFYNEELVNGGGGSFSQQSSVPMGGGCPSNKSPSSWPSKWPSNLPSEQPSSASSSPSHLPSSSPSITPIQNVSCSLFTMNLQTDLYGEDISWILEINTRGKYWNLLARNSGPFSGETFYEKDLCIPQNNCFKFTINDAANDGLCCNHSKGFYRIFLDGQLVKYSIYSNSAEKEETVFGTSGKMC